jgi:hypothetical protein
MLKCQRGGCLSSQNFLGPVTQVTRRMVWTVMGALGLEVESWSPGSKVCQFCDLREVL